VAHVSNIEFVRWLDRAAELHADSLGYTRRWMLDHGVMWFVARHEVDYLAEALPGDELAIATWVRDMRKVKSWRDYVIVRPADQTIVCRAATLWVFVDLATRRPMRIPAEMAARFQPVHPSCVVPSTDAIR
jgi:acyl-CoA thioester hydrolase